MPLTETVRTDSLGSLMTSAEWAFRRLRAVAEATHNMDMEDSVEACEISLATMKRERKEATDALTG